MKSLLISLSIVLTIVLNLNAQTFRLHENGVTVVCEGAQPGEKGVILGKTYTSVDFSMLKTMVTNGDDVSQVCTSNLTNLYRMFYRERQFNDDISTWDVSNVTNMRGTFRSAESFNQDISNWDVSNVTDFTFLFSFTNVFNQNIGNWDVSNVTDMSQIFYGAETFNQDIGSWDVSKVVSLKDAFRSANSFNQDLSSWDVSNVRDMSYTFSSADAFNQDIGNWDVSNVTTMQQMFIGAEAFNQDIGNWDVSNVTTMRSMFYQAYRFNQNLNNWNLNNLNDMYQMFAFASDFNGTISNWNVSNVSNMSEVFSNTDNFNQDLSNWDVSNVTNMKGMFAGTDNFNSDISNWNVSSVSNMDEMFLAAASFNQDLSEWCVEKINSAPIKFNAESIFNEESILSTEYLPNWGTCPNKPDKITLLSPQNNSVNVSINNLTTSWEKDSNSHQYQLTIFENFSVNILDTILVDSSANLTLNLKNSTTYNWRVRGVSNNNLIGEWSDFWNFNTRPSDVSEVWLIEPIDISTTTTISPTLVWNADENAEFYKVQLSSDDFTSTLIDTSIADTTYSSNNLDYSTNYQWRVKSINSVSESEWSQPWSFTTRIANVTGVSLRSPVDELINAPISLNLVWTSDPYSSSYQIQLSKDEFATTFLDQELADTTFSASNLSYSANYLWRVRAKNAYSTSSWSTSRTFTTRPASVSGTILVAPANASNTDIINPNLVWLKDAYAESYHVQLSKDEFTTTIIDQSTTDTMVATSGLAFNMTYQWRVKAINSVSESDWSQPWSFTTRIGDVSGVVLFNPKNDSSLVPINPSFGWSSDPNASTYQLQLSTDSFTSISIDQELADTTFTTSNLSYSTNYQWRVRAKNAYSTSEWSTPRVFTTRQADVSTTTLASPENNATTNTIEPTLTWLRAANADSFRVQLSSDQFSTIIVDSSLVDTTISTPSLTYNTIYQWRVKAKNTVSESDWSQPWSFTTRLPDVTGVSIISPKIDSMDAPLDVQLVWSSDSNATAYELEYYGGINTKSTNGEHHEVKNSVFISDTTFTPTDLINESFVNWKVRSVNDYSVSEWSTGRFSVRPANTGNISLLSPENNETTDTIYPDLYFSRDRSAYWYRIQVTTDTFENTLIDTLYSLFYESVMTFIPSTLTYNTTYKWRVKAVNSVSESEWTEPWSFTTRVADVTIVSLNSPTNNEVLDLIAPTFVWNKEVNASSYQLEVSSDNFASTIISEILSDTTFSGVNLENGKSYSWRVKAINAYSESEWTTYSFEIPVTTSIRNEDLPTKTELLPNYPNPFNPSTQIRFSLAESSLTTLDIYSIDGTRVASLVNQVLNAGWHTATFNASNLPTGLYLYRLNTGKQQITKKMLLVK